MNRPRALERIGAAVARHQDKSGPTLDAEDGLKRFRTVVDRDVPRRGLQHLGRQRWVALAVAAAALLAVLVVGARSWLFTERLTFTVDGAPALTESLTAGEWLSVREPAVLRFSDGTQVVAIAGSRLRVSETTSAGATVQLERGELTLDVRSREDTRWQVDAGPFNIQVTGTEFATSWDPVREVFELRMDEGKVLLSGPVVGGQREVKAPEHLHIDVASQKLVVVGEHTAEAPEAPQDAAEPTPGDPIPAETAAGETPSTVEPASSGPALVDATHPDSGEPTPTDPTWRELAGKGKHAEAAALLRDLDQGALLAAEPAAGLLLVAQTARLGGEHALASAALAALQKRFPKSVEAGTARFLNGKLRFDQGRYDEAVTALSEYLASPTGGFAGEAEVLLILALDRAGRVAEAQALAGKYLERHPTGPHAARIRGLVQP